jgi:UDP-glucose 4-epimerase
MSKILITGVAGLIGSRLADYLCDNHEIIGIDDLSGGYIENVNSKVNFYNINLSSSNDLKNIFEKHKPEYVFHLAAYAAEGLSPFIRKFNYENNLISTTRLINESIKHDVKRFIFTSSMAVYGKAIPPFREDYIPNPIDPYGIAKYACEMDLQIAGEQHGLDWCIIRPHNVYGIKQNIWDKYRNVLGIWMYNVLNGNPITIYGDGNQERAFSYIDDCLPYFWESAINPKCSKQIFNMGGDRTTTINEASEIMLKVVGPHPIIYLEERHEVKHAWVSHDKIKNILNFESKTSIEDGLTTMWNWAKTQPNRIRKEWSEYELEKGIYNFWKVKK